VKSTPLNGDTLVERVFRGTTFMQNACAFAEVIAATGLGNTRNQAHCEAEEAAGFARRAELSDASVRRLNFLKTSMKALPPRACKENLNLQEDKSIVGERRGLRPPRGSSVIPCSGAKVWQQIQNLAHVKRQHQ